MNSNNSGYTLVELMIVILIIAILMAAVAGPSILGGRKRGEDSAAKQELVNSARVAASYYASERVLPNAVAMTAEDEGHNYIDFDEFPAFTKPATIAIGIDNFFRTTTASGYNWKVSIGQGKVGAPVEEE